METKPSIPLHTLYKMGPFNLSRRIVLAPLTRQRSYGNITQPHAELYYTQRTTPGGLLISEACVVSETSKGYIELSGYTWNMDQRASGGMEAHRGCGSFERRPAKWGSSCFLYRQAIDVQEHLWRSGQFTPPRRLRTDEIPAIVNDFSVAARNAIEAGN
ncbi:unnamed protein product [Arabis nemorensis]|uniref:NADH:flavin oxidoreductase/NADH oxidase N-terminal domain-containing protein n=1 Tax=Arabis nemorensis TaxID=586526 RepID=A0A565ASX4_9BRAS|nr:unnamed protein product [Arabis nemorensis]